MQMLVKVASGAAGKVASVASDAPLVAPLVASFDAKVVPKLESSGAVASASAFELVEASESGTRRS